MRKLPREKKLRKVYIHLGMPKTASTAMQQHVFPKITSHNYILKGDIRHIILTLDDLPTFISYENFIGYPHINYRRKYNGFLKTRQSSLQALGSLFPDADTILVIRNHVDLVKSLYNQFIKVGGSISFKDYISTGSEHRLEIEALIYEDLIADIKSHFSGRLLVIDHRLIRDNLDMFEHVLLDFIGSTDYGIFTSLKDKRSNESLSMQQLRAQLWVNAFLKTDFKSDGIDLGQRGFKIGRYLAANVLAKMYTDESVFGEAELMVLYDYFYDDQQHMCRLLEAGFAIL